MILIGGVLLTAVLLLLVASFQRPDSGGTVLIMLDGQEYARLPLGSPQTVTIDCGNGESNVLSISEAGFRMQSATCRDQLCVEQGEVTLENHARRALGADIICLPHRLVCSLVSDGTDTVTLTD